MDTKENELLKRKRRKERELSAVVVGSNDASQQRQQSNTQALVSRGLTVKASFFVVMVESGVCPVAAAGTTTRLLRSV